MRLYHYLESKWALDDIRRHRLKLSKIDDMNDPYEWKCVRSDHRPSQEALEKTEKEIVEIYSVLCFSLSWNNILMWSHYSERHKGICLGFDVPKKMTREVKYVPTILEVGDLTKFSRREKKAALDRLYYTKHEDWCYEREFRVHGSRVERDEETGQYFVPFDALLKLKAVIAGARFSMTKNVIKEALKGYSGVQVFKARASTASFEIVRDRW
jgi:hypothetical protein